MKYISRVVILFYGTKTRVRISKIRNIVGEKFGRFLVIEFSGTFGKHRFWKCICTCSKKQERVIREDHLFGGYSKSCGCLQQEMCGVLGRRSKTHGMTNTRVYGIWRAMLTRCENTKHPTYIHYGGRGIKVCKRWHTFENFYTDMGDRPTLKHTLDRIDNNGHYCKKNCRWATRKEQQRNRRVNHVITFRGKTQCLSAWSEELGLMTDVINKRIAMGWPVVRAFTTPIQVRIVRNRWKQ